MAIIRIAIILVLSNLLFACGGNPFQLTVETVDSALGPVRAMKINLKEDGEVQIERIEVNDNSCTGGGTREINKIKPKFSKRGDHIALSLARSCGDIYNARIITVAGETYDYSF